MNIFHAQKFNIFWFHTINTSSYVWKEKWSKTSRRTTRSTTVKGDSGGIGEVDRVLELQSGSSKTSQNSLVQGQTNVKEINDG